MKLLLQRGPDRGYFPEPAKSTHICDQQEEAEMVREIFKAGCVVVKIHDGFRYVGGYIGGKEEESEWVQQKVTEWASGVCILAWFA
eukprot:4538414-Ditylum_brightwellii.AAC.1